MKTKPFLFMLSALMIASFAFACAPKTPEERVVKTLDTIHAKFVDAKDCDKLAKDLDSYCKDVHDQLAADYKLVLVGVMTQLMSGEKSTPGMDKVEAALNKYDGLENSACAQNEKAAAALENCMSAIDALDNDE